MVLLINLVVAVKEESRKRRESKFSDRLLKLMREMFGAENVNWSRTEEDKIEVLVDSNLAVLNTKTLVRKRLDRGHCSFSVTISLSIFALLPPQYTHTHTLHRL